MALRMCSGLCFSVVLAASASAADYRVEVLDEGPPADKVSAKMIDQLSATGLRVIRGSTRTYCDIWLLKQWDIAAGFKPTAEILYPFRPGQLVGLARFSRRASDFRDQRINRGVYTLRYAHQPVDGSHVGTSPTRDFLLLVNAESDKSVDGMGEEDLVTNSAEAAGTTHPCMLSLQRASGQVKSPSIRHFEEFDWWIVGLRGQIKSGATPKPLAMELVIVGQARE